MYQVHVNIRQRGEELLCITFTLRPDVKNVGHWVDTAMRQLGYNPGHWDMEYQVTPKDI